MKSYPFATWIIYTLSRLSTAIVLMYKTMLINNMDDSVAQDPLLLWVAAALVILLLDPRAFVLPKEMRDAREPKKAVVSEAP